MRHPSAVEMTESGSPRRWEIFRGQVRVTIRVRGWIGSENRLDAIVSWTGLWIRLLAIGSEKGMAICFHNCFAFSSLVSVEMPSNAIECFGAPALLDCVHPYQNWTSQCACPSLKRWTLWLRSFNVQESWSADRTLMLPFLVLLNSDEVVHSLAGTNRGCLDDPFDGRVQRLVAGQDGELHGQILAPVVSFAFPEADSPDVGVVRVTCYMSSSELDRFKETQARLRNARGVILAEKQARASLPYPTFNGFGGQVRSMEGGDLQVQILLPAGKFEPRFLDPLAMSAFGDGLKGLPERETLPEAVIEDLVSREMVQIPGRPFFGSFAHLIGCLF